MYPDIGSFAVVVLAVIVGFVFLATVVIVPIIIKSMKEAKEEKEYQKKRISEKKNHPKQ